MLFLKSSLAAGALTSALALDLLCAGAAYAHVSISSGPGYAGQNQIVTFSVGHGCEGADTQSIEVSIPKEVTGLRALPSTFGGTLEVKKDDAGAVTSVVWRKPDVRAADDLYYEMRLRFKVPDAPFSSVFFSIRQTCRTSGGEERVVDWNGLPGDEPAADGEEAEPAAELRVLPARKPGWNKFTVKDKLEDLTVFDDAQIVWSGEAAYSSNEETKKQIAAESDVDELTSIEAGATIWVKY
jgi:periplasmic copper chaperone A